MDMEEEGSASNFFTGNRFPSYGYAHNFLSVRFDLCVFPFLSLVRPC